jgi:ATP-dependent 26S proteasome regulatory subunit
VFFDECDERFRSRSEGKSDDGHNIPSFAIASMLPKLQKLHDARKVLFILGTNCVRIIDSAIIRSGRCDAVILFDRPDCKGRSAAVEAIFAKKRDDGTLPVPLPKSAGDLADMIDGWLPLPGLDLKINCLLQFEC